MPRIEEFLGIWDARVKGVRQMVTWRLKDCPRCGGDTYIDRDIDGWYQQCLMCAYRLELKELNYRKKPLTVFTAEEDEEDRE